MQYYMWKEYTDVDPEMFYKCDGRSVWVYNENGKLVNWRVASVDKSESFFKYPNTYPEISEDEFKMWIMQ